MIVTEETLLWQKRAGIITESEYREKLEKLYLEEKLFIDKKGNLTGEADFVVLEGGVKGGIFKSKDQINVDDYVHFTTRFDSFNKTKISNTIYNQILTIYNQSTLKKYNKSINFTPFLEYGKSKGGFSVSTFTIKLSEELDIIGTIDKSDYRYGKDISQMYKAFGKTPPPNNSDVEDLEVYIQNVPITFIPKYYFLGKVAKEANVQTLNPPFIVNKHTLYSKSELLKDLNEIGSFLTL